MTEPTTVYIAPTGLKKEEPACKVSGVIGNIRKATYEPKQDRTILTIELEEISLEDAMLLTQLSHAKTPVKISLETIKAIYK